MTFSSSDAAKLKAAALFLLQTEMCRDGSSLADADHINNSQEEEKEDEEATRGLGNSEQETQNMTQHSV